MSTKIPFELSTEKIIESPRTFNTNQIKNAVQNILLTPQGALHATPLQEKCAEYILKDFFLYMHQTGIYNRQLKLWKAIGNVSELSFYHVENTFTKKEKPDLKLIDFSCDPQRVAICALIPESKGVASNALTSHLSLALGLNNSSKLKGIFYFTKDKDITGALQKVTDPSHPISKYESIIKGTNDVRLNVIVYKEENESYKFEHVFPQVNKEVEDVRVQI